MRNQVGISYLFDSFSLYSVIFDFALNYSVVRLICLSTISKQFVSVLDTYR